MKTLPRFLALLAALTALVLSATQCRRAKQAPVDTTAYPAAHGEKPEPAELPKESWSKLTALRYCDLEVDSEIPSVSAMSECL